LTYRFYDFDRIDAATGQKRDLQIDQAIEVTTVPHQAPTLTQKTTQVGDATVTQLVSATYFTVNKVDLAGEATFTKAAPYTLQTIIDGQGTLSVDGHEHVVKKGESFILPSDVKECALSGQLSMIQSYVTQ
jgi:mannose-6-phosphate isomerase